MHLNGMCRIIREKEIRVSECGQRCNTRVEVMGPAFEVSTDPPTFRGPQVIFRKFPAV